MKKKSLRRWKKLMLSVALTFMISSNQVMINYAEEENATKDFEEKAEEVIRSDKSEEKTRNSEHANKLREITKNKGIDEAILFVIEDWTLPKAIKDKKLIHPNSICARNDLIIKIKGEN